MQSPHFNHRRSLAAALVFATTFAGCSGAPSAFGPTGSAASTSHRTGPLATVAATVGIRNASIKKISGSGSAICWNISPSLPTVDPGDLSGPVILSYNTLCPTLSMLHITYGPGSSVASNCTFNVGYNGMSFTYSATQGTSTACSVAVSPITGYNEILTYDQATPGARKTHPLHLQH